jgi:hypothetical protein
LRSEDLKQKAREKISEFEPMAELFRRMVRCVNEGILADKEIHFGSVVGELAEANEDSFRVKIGRGSMKYPWYSLAPQKLLQFFEKINLTENDLFLVGVYCFENDLLDEGNRIFLKLLEKSPPRKEEIDRYLARKLGIPIPEGGFTAYRGRLVSRDEREKRLEGFVRYRSQWVTPEEKEKLEAGFVRTESGEWITLDEEKMRAKGYLRYQEKWYRPEELAELRKNWEHAWTLQTAHYDLKCNVSEDFAEELGRFLDAAWTEYSLFFGKEVADRMNIYAFRTNEDYRKFCQENGYADQIRAGGFATNRANLGVGWMRETKEEMFNVMIHEGAHLYQYKAFPRAMAPSWFSEAIATQFEGYKWDGKKLSMSFLSPRLIWMQRALSNRTFFSLNDLIGRNALELINNDPTGAATFYSQCWGLFYFLKRSEPHKARLQDYVQRTLNAEFTRRETEMFLSVFGAEMPQLEPAWHRFILALDSSQLQLQMRGF